MTTQKLEERWQDYSVYYTGLSIDKPSAIMFDPKEDERELTSHRWWIQVKDQEELSEIIGVIKTSGNFDPKVWRILGADNHFYGYMYTAWDHARIKVVDERTLWVDDLHIPPEVHDCCDDTLDRPEPR